MVIDGIVLALLVLFVIRGWVSGMVREAIDVGTLVLGVVLAFRLAPHAGRILAGAFGVSSDLARLIGGTVLFVGISIGAAIAGSVIHRSIKHLPGLTTLNRIGGAALGVVYALVLTVAAVTLLSAAPLPEAAAVQVDESEVVAYVVRPEGPAQRAVGVVTGDRALQSMIWIRGVVDGWVIDPRFTDVTLPGDAGGGNVHASTAAGTELYESINRDRTEAGLEPLMWSEAMSLVAVTRAAEVYRTGSFAGASSVTDRLDAAGVDHTVAHEYLMLAPTIDGLTDAAEPGVGFADVGIGVVEGPYGFIAVIVLSD
jgi:membrane protein required for colicin V production